MKQDDSTFYFQCKSLPSSLFCRSWITSFSFKGHRQNITVPSLHMNKKWVTFYYVFLIYQIFFLCCGFLRILHPPSCGEGGFYDSIFLSYPIHCIYQVPVSWKFAFREHKDKAVQNASKEGKFIFTRHKWGMTYVEKA